MNQLNILLQETDSLKEKLSTLRPLSGQAVKKIQNALELEYTYESNRIEGNTLTLQETALIVNEGVTISGKSMREHLEAINHAQAIEFIKDIAKDDLQIDERIIKDIHALILHGIDKENAGKYRTVQVMISGSKHMPPQPFLIGEQIEQFIKQYHRMEEEKVHPVLTAAYLHDELVKIHLFIDGNGRTSRLLMNLYLLGKGYVILNLKGDNESKVRYYLSLEKSHVEGITEDFNTLVAEAEKDALKKYLELLS